MSTNVGGQTKSLRMSIVLACLMVVAALAGTVARVPSHRAGTAPRFTLDTMVPRQFGDWQELPQRDLLVVNPQTQQLIDKLYSQVLTRTYVNSKGYRVMLSMAYGDDQRGDLQAHKPEVCYPAQGFALHSNVEDRMGTPYGPIDVRRLNTSFGARKEPVTYWFTVSDTAVRNKLQQRLIELRLSLTGNIPDGLLVRISSIDDSPERAFVAHDAFATALLASVPLTDRSRLAGLTAR